MTAPVDWAIRASILVALALVAAACARRHSASLRHLLLAAGVAGSLALPALSFVTPSWELPAPVGVASLPTVLGDQVTGGMASPAATSAANTSPSNSAAATALAQMIYRIVPIGAVASMLLLVVGLSRLAWLSRTGEAVRAADWQRLLHDSWSDLDVGREVRLLRSDRISLPMTWGCRRPCIILPRAADTWTDARRRAVLLHELAHVGRGDWVLHVSAEMLRAVLWFNPLIWVLCRRLRHESEIACDDRVLQAGVPGAEYAAHLVALARTARGPRLPMPAPAIAATSSLERRVRVMLNPDVDRRRIGKSRRLVIWLAAAAVAMSVAGGNAAQSFATFAASIVDSQYGVLPGVTVTLTGESTGTRYEVKSSRAGRIELPGLPPGVYGVEVSLPGFSTLRSRLLLQDGERAEPQLMLQVGQIEETVSVTDDPGGARTAQYWNKSPLPPCPATPAAADGAVIGGNIRPPRRTVNVPPAYPATLSGSGSSGAVQLTAEIGTDGRVSGISVISGEPVFTAAAVEAVRQWEWTPTLLNCQAVAIRATVYVNFTGR